MVKTLRLLAVGSFIATTLASCAGAASSSTGPPNVTGTWRGGTATGTKTMTLHLQQTGTNVTGTVEGVGTPGGQIHGVVGGNAVQLNTERGAWTRLVVRGDLMDGELNGIPMTLVRLGRG